MGKKKGIKNITTLKIENKDIVNEDSMAYKIIKHMREYGEIDRYTAIKKYKIDTFSQTIHYLRKIGYNIKSKAAIKNGVYFKKYYLENSNVEPQEEGLIIVEAKNDNDNKKTLKQTIKDYLIEHGEISVEKAINEFGWHRVRQYVNEFRYKGMNIESVKDGKSTIYVLKSEEEYKPQPVKVAKTIIEKKIEKPQVIDNTKIMRIRKTQREAILEHLLTYGKITSIEARDLYNCTCLPSIIKYLKDDGYKITTTKDRCYKSQNTKVDRLQACAVYTMDSTKRTKNQFIIVAGFNMAYSSLCPNYNGIFEKFDDAFNEAQKVANEMKNKLNDIVDSDNIQFCNRSVGDVVCIIKIEKVKKLFGTKIKETEVARFNIIENTVEV